MEGIDFGAEKYESAKSLLQDEVDNYRQYVDEEFNRGVQNTWPNCVISRLTAMSAFLEMAEEEGEISREESDKMQNKLKRAAAHAQEMQQKYPTVDVNIPSKEKEDMLEMLDIL